MMLLREPILILTLALKLFACATAASADQQTESQLATTTSAVIYLGNEGVLVEHKGSKILFDPFFHNGFGYYQLVPENIRQALLNGQAPYDNIDAIFISHAHADHFSAEDIVKFLHAFPTAKLIAPTQAVRQIEEIADISAIRGNISALALKHRDAPIHQNLGKFQFDAVRIPHAGWPQRAEISNLVYHVTLGGELTVVHMGDADTDDEHYKPLMAHWQQRAVDTAFPPYWFFLSKSGQMVLTDRIAAQTNIGVHVPVKVPADLKATGEQYFSLPGERHELGRR